jgi:hypothetical protein
MFESNGDDRTQVESTRMPLPGFRLIAEARTEWSAKVVNKGVNPYLVLSLRMRGLTGRE